MRTPRFVASLVMGLALVMGTVTVSTASADTERALPTCKAFTTYKESSLIGTLHTNIPTTGAGNRDTRCKLQWGDEYPGVVVLQDAISRCFAPITLDGKYYGETQSAVRFIQGSSPTPITPDGVYGPDTAKVMDWPWYTIANGYVGCD